MASNVSELNAELDNNIAQSGEAWSGFSLFGDLPAELRHHIWESFCPDLTAKSVVFEFYLLRIFGGVIHARTLASQTATLRAVLATHSESRAIALRRFPDTLRGELKRDVIRFNRDVDIVYIAFSGPFGLPTEGERLRRGFFENIRHLAIDPAFMYTHSGTFIEILPFFTALRTLYLCHVDTLFDNPQELRWCTSKSALSHLHNSNGGESDTIGPLKRVFSWPDSMGHRDVTEELRKDPNLQLDRLREMISAARLSLTTKNGIITSTTPDDAPPSVLTCEIWPMIIFATDRGVSRFRRLATWSGAAEDWDPVDDWVEDNNYSDSDGDSDLLAYIEGGLRTSFLNMEPSESDEDNMAERFAFLQLI